MKNLKLFLIVGILVLSIVAFGCSSAQNTVPQKNAQITQNNIRNTVQNSSQSPAASDEKDIQTASDDFSQIDNALGVY